MYRNYALSFLAFGLAAAAASGALASPQSVREHERTLATMPPAAASSDKYTLGSYYTHSNRRGEGRKQNGDMLTLRLSERLDAGRTQFITLTGDDTGYSNKAIKDESDTLAASYGQIWGSREHPGLIYFASAFGSKGWSDTSVGTTGLKDSYGLGVIGGAMQVVPLSAADRFFVGSSFTLSYLQISGTKDEEQGMGLMAAPTVQYNRDLTKNLSGYVQLGAIFSTRDANLTGGGALVMPSMGLDYTLGQYKLGAQYTYEYIDDHRGSRVGFSVSRSF